MKVLLVNPPINYLDTTDLAPPLGLLILAALARQAGHNVRVLDLNLEVLDHPRLGEDNFYEDALKLILHDPPDVIGLTSMAMESHVSLELARQVKAYSKNIKTILGGTHFGAIATDIIQRFDFIDFVVAGEGESGFLDILAYLKGETTTLPKNVIAADLTVASRQSKPFEAASLEEFPSPAYDLIDLPRYFRLNPRRQLCFDSGRGCIFKCAFCYSPHHYGDNVRDKKTDAIIKELRELTDLGCKHVFFVQDNLLNSRAWANDLCQKLKDAKLPLTWSCYVTYPQLTHDLIDSLSAAGCSAIFTGVDAVAPNAQVRMNKRFLKDSQSLSDKLQYCLSRKIIPTCAFILEGPDQPDEEVEATLRCAIECVNLGAEIHINTLTVYNGSDLDHRYEGRSPVYSQAKVELLMDAAPVVLKNPFAVRHPRLFPYHVTYDEPDRWEIFLAKVQIAFSILHSFPRTLQKLVLNEGNSFWETLNYVDEQVTANLKEQPKKSRRRTAIESCLERITIQALSETSKKAFQQELLRFQLSQAPEFQRVHLVTDLSSASYLLNSFIEAPIEASVLRDVTSDGVDSDCVFALLSNRVAVKFFSVGRSFASLLRQCQRAASTKTPLRISEGDLSRLEREGWIEPEPVPNNSQVFQNGQEVANRNELSKHRLVG
jgi:radical SAM superfamily enzyme YgiQ (UPF0313 family)